MCPANVCSCMLDAKYQQGNEMHSVGFCREPRLSHLFVSFTLSHQELQCDLR